jgi:molybdopterin-containing oxidoreductase family iron-sulfur binding subunit
MPQETAARSPRLSVGDLARLRAKLEATRGREYWKSLEELSESPEVREYLQREFPTPIEAGVDRREFLTLMGASLALAGLTGCTRQPAEKIFPYVRVPEGFVPGKPLFYATSLPLSGYARGVLVESHMGRPTKVEGNPEHPESLGATDLFAQAEILSLYDPDRSQTLTELSEIRPWSAFLAAARLALEKAREKGGEGLRFLSGTETSPTLAAGFAAILGELPGARWHRWEPLTRDAVAAGARMAFGEAVDTIPSLDRADVVVCLDADPLGEGPGQLRRVREFATRRHATIEGASSQRLWSIESSPTLTGARSDHRLGVTAGRVSELAVEIAGLLGVGAAPANPDPFARAAAEDLRAAGSGALLLVGPTQPAGVHALAHAVHARLGAVGATVVHVEPVEARPVDQTESLRELAADMEAGKVDTLVILGGNPVYTAPVDLAFAERMRRVPVCMHLSPHQDETSELCQWHVPEAHPLEAWGDSRSEDGTVTIHQPLIAPLYGGRSAIEVLAAFSSEPEKSGAELVKEHWARARGGADFEAFWRRAIHDGVVPATASPARTVALRDASAGEAIAALRAARSAAAASEGAFEVLFRADPSVYDGRYANNGWLQELPKALTKLTWDNAFLISPAMATRLDLASGEEIEVTVGEASVVGPIWIMPGHPDGAITAPLGYGRRRIGRVALGAGFDAYALRRSSALWTAPGGTLRKAGRRKPLACTQGHHTMEGRPIVLSATRDEYAKDPQTFHHRVHEPGPEMSLHPSWEYKENAWGMTIDLATCIGCNACVVACQAENNIPVVGRKEVLRGREMQWIRVDRYYTGSLDAPTTVHQPLPCMHCENAPCELVCPVAATVHSAEGLNDMVYNRCVGTRYCGNNCPYKVRRFNFFLYSDWTTESVKLARNPDVTVRSRGVMEKCSYCVQRISAARIDAEREGRSIRDGEIVTACQQVCPARAITFGDLNDPESAVARRRAEPRNYGLLTDLGTRPRTSYLGEIRNPHPALAGEEQPATPEHG